MATNDGSILTQTKKTLGLAEDYTVFDTEIIIHINSVIGTLNQLGIGPEDGFEVVDDEQKWSDFIGTDLKFAPVKSYIYLRVRLLFDPPEIGFVLTAMKEQIEQLEWRLNVVREDRDHPYIDPNVSVDV